jgi:hypothetical protein
MTLVITEVKSMVKRPSTEPDPPVGPIIAENLIRLGFVEQVVQTATVAKLVTEKTGSPMSRQRVSAILNAVRVKPSTVARLAKGIGVKPEELTKRKPR